MLDTFSMTKVRPTPSIGTVVEIHVPPHARRQPPIEGVVVEIVPPGRLPRARLSGGPCEKRIPRYVIRYAGGAVIRDASQMRIIAL